MKKAIYIVFRLREEYTVCLVTLWQQFTCRFCDSSWIIFTFFFPVFYTHNANCLAE